MKAKPRANVIQTHRHAFRHRKGPRQEYPSEEGPHRLEEEDCSIHEQDELLEASINGHNQNRRSAMRPDPWENVRKEMFDKLLSTSQARNEQLQGRRDSLHREIQENINKHSVLCPTCGAREDPFTCTVAKHQRQVLWVGVGYRFIVSVPVRVCGLCDARFSCCPLDVGCLPGSPEEAWNVASCKDEHVPIWFDLDLIRFLEDGTNVIRCFSMC